MITDAVEALNKSLSMASSNLGRHSFTVTGSENIARSIRSRSTYRNSQANADNAGKKGIIRGEGGGGSVAPERFFSFFPRIGHVVWRAPVRGTTSNANNSDPSAFFFRPWQLLRTPAQTDLAWPAPTKERWATTKHKGENEKKQKRTHKFSPRFSRSKESYRKAQSRDRNTYERNGAPHELELVSP